MAAPPNPIPMSQKLFDFALVLLGLVLIAIASATSLPYGIVFTPERALSLYMAGSFLLGIAVMKLGALA